jgi:hypothetical protein
VVGNILSDGLAVGLLVVGLDVGRLDGLLVVSLAVGRLVGLLVVGLAVGILVGLFVVGLSVGLVVGDDVVTVADEQSVAMYQVGVVGELDGFINALFTIAFRTSEGVSDGFWARMAAAMPATSKRYNAM